MMNAIGGGAAAGPASLALDPLRDFAFPQRALAFATDNVLAVAPHFAQLNGTPAKFSMDPNGRFRALRHSRAQFGQTIFDYFQFDCSAGHEIISTRPHQSEYFLFVPFRGAIEVIQGRQRIEVAPGQIALVGSAGSYTQKRYGGSAELLVVQILRRTLMKTLADEYGVFGDAVLEFEPRIVADLAGVPTLGRFIGMLCRDVGETRSCTADPATARSCERALILLLLRSFPHNLHARLAEPGSPATPFYVRRAAEYVRENMDQSITAADLAVRSGVSVRSLYYGFQKAYGLTPMKYLKQIRLNAARRALRDAHRDQLTVTEIALNSGYGNLSSFCRDYRAHFGEAPSQTARRG